MSQKQLSLGVVMDPIEAISYKKDSTMAMLWAAAERGWDLHYIQPADLYLADGLCRIRSRTLKVLKDPDHWFELGDSQDRMAEAFDVLLMRKDPPFDNEFLYSTHLLEQAERQGVLVVNRPSSLRDCNEKLFATQFPQCIPPQIVTRSAALLKQFHSDHGDVIMKPLDGMGGSSIFRLVPDDKNVSVIIETLTRQGQETIMAQRYVPEIKDGDKRILLIGGEPVEYCLARIPAKGETRGNLAAGGRGEARPLSEKDRWIAEQVKSSVQALGLHFVGLDVIGDYLTEINVTSPTCIREIDDQFGTDIGGQLMDYIARLLEQNEPS